MTPMDKLKVARKFGKTAKDRLDLVRVKRVTKRFVFEVRQALFRARHDILAPAEKAPRKAAPKTSRQAPRKKADTVTEESRRNATAGRKDVASGTRPSLKKAMVQVISSDVVNAVGVVKRLEARGWMPQSNDPRQYISYMLSSNTPMVFERTEKRGFYRVRPGYSEPKHRPKGPLGPKIMRLLKENEEWTTVTAKHLGDCLKVDSKVLGSPLRNLVAKGFLLPETVDGKTLYHVVR